MNTSSRPSEPAEPSAGGMDSGGESPPPEDTARRDVPDLFVPPASGYMPSGVESIGLGPVLPRQELSDEPWEFEYKPRWHRKWLRGWRLLFILMLVAGGYVAWRGEKDYLALKRWRARELAAEALRQASNNPADARGMLDEAAILAPGDGEVMRAMVDFCEPRHDLMALRALRELTRGPEATMEDWERLSRLAFEWNHPQLAPAELLNAWASGPVEKLTPGQMKLASRWLITRGRSPEAERRLRDALALKATPDVEVALCGLLLANPGQPGEAESRMMEALDRLSTIGADTAVPAKVRADAVRLQASVLLRKENAPLLTPARAGKLKTSFETLDADPNAPGALGHRLAAISVDLAANPARREELIRPVMQTVDSRTAEERLTIARWLYDSGSFPEVMSVCAGTQEAATDPRWFTVRLDAMFALKDLEKAAELLASPDQPLPAITRDVFLLRIDRALGRDALSMAERMRRLEGASTGAGPLDIVRAAENLERAGETAAALSLYRKVNQDERVDLTARLGIVRCLDASQSRTGELIEALESVLRLWPHMEDARNDLIYLKLVDDIAESGEMDLAVSQAGQSPWFFSYRLSGALAELRRGHAKDAMAILDKAPVAWEKLKPGWQAVSGAILAANGRLDEARAIKVRLRDVGVRPGERKLLDQHLKELQ